MKIAIAGGGTGGHLYSGLALAEAWTATADGRTAPLSRSDIHFIGGSYGLEGAILPATGFAFSLLPAQPFRGRGLLAQLRALWGLWVAWIAALRLLRRLKIDCVIGIGGYASLPALFAACCLAIPRVLIEQNAVPGLANRILGRLVQRVFIHFSAAEKFFHSGKVVRSGNPIRPSVRVALVSDESSQKSTGGPLQILVLGGSQGARAVNTWVLEWVKRRAVQDKSNFSIRVVHQTGKTDEVRIKEAYGALCLDSSRVAIEVHPFLDPIAPFYKAADLVIARAGAGTIGELAAVGRASLLIPYPYAAGDHQAVNAEAMAALGAAVVEREEGLSADAFCARVDSLLSDRDALREMGKAAKGLDFPHAAEVIWRECEKLFPLGAAGRIG